MMEGRVTATPEALLTLKVSGPQGHESEIEAILDTGFTDYLTLPRSIIAALHLPFMDTAQCQLADGCIVSMESFLLTVLWHGTPREILALAADGDPLLGMALLIPFTNHD